MTREWIGGSQVNSQKEIDVFWSFWGLISQLSSTGTWWSCFTLLTTCGPCFELESGWHHQIIKLSGVKDCHCLVGSKCLFHMLLLSYPRPAYPSLWLLQPCKVFVMQLVFSCLVQSRAFSPRKFDAEKEDLQDTRSDWRTHWTELFSHFSEFLDYFQTWTSASKFKWQTELIDSWFLRRVSELFS